MTLTKLTCTMREVGDDPSDPFDDNMPPCGDPNVVAIGGIGDPERATFALCADCLALALRDDPTLCYFDLSEVATANASGDNDR